MATGLYECATRPNMIIDNEYILSLYMSSLEIHVDLCRRFPDFGTYDHLIVEEKTRKRFLRSHIWKKYDRLLLSYIFFELISCCMVYNLK